MKSKIDFSAVSAKIRTGTKKLRRLNDKTLRLNKRVGLSFAGNLVTYAMLIALSGIFLAPFVYMLGGSVMSNKDIADVNVTWIPRSIVWDNYSYAIMAMDYFKRLALSFLISGVCVLGQVVSCSFVGYGIARIKFKLNPIVFVFVLCSMIVPPQTLIVSQYLMFSKWGIVHTWLPVILPCFFSLGLNGGLFVFIFRQYYRGMPKELENAAMLDGLGSFGTYFRIMVPSASSIMLVTSILSFIWQWNNYFEPSIYINSEKFYTVTMMLRSTIFVNAVSGGGISYTSGISLAATVLSSMPVIIIFFILQKRFVKGIETAGLAN